MSMLSELEARAGASSADREEWLAERLSGITATEVRDLVKEGPAFRRKLLRIKRGDEVAPWVSTEFTEWGHLREPVLIQAAAEYGIEPESRVFHAADDPRFLASPDGVGWDFDGLTVAECKTSKHDIAPGSPHFEAYGYADQMQWQMHVTGAEKCLYIWEQHEAFIPGPIRTEWVHRDQDRITELIGIASAFLEDLGQEQTVDPTLRALVEARETARAVAAEADANLRAYVEAQGIGSADVGGWTVSYSTPKPRRAFDQQAFKAAHAGLYQEFTRAGEPGKPVLRVTRKKETQNG